MPEAWPWLVVVASGALHGLNPCSGWGLALACGVHAGRPREALRALLLPIVLGHVAAIAAVAAAVNAGLSPPGGALQVTAAIVLLMALALRRWPLLRAAAGRASLMLGSFIAASVQGAGLMLVPALTPLCFGANSAREIDVSSSLLLALAALALHLAAMSMTTAAVAFGACRIVDRQRRREPQPSTSMAAASSSSPRPSASSSASCVPPSADAASRSRARHSSSCGSSVVLSARQRRSR